MRPSRLFRSVSWPQAAVEVLLIVVGISLALGAQAWWDYRAERSDEVELLSQIFQTLTTDRDSLQMEVDGAARRAALLADLREHLVQGLPYSDSLSENFAALRYWQTSNINPAPYEDLKARGLHIVSDQRLRLMLIDFFERAVPTVQDRDAIDRAQTMNYSATVLQYQMTWNSNVYAPVDYARSLASPEFMYMVTHRTGGVRRAAAEYSSLLNQTDALLTALRADVSKK